MSLESLSDWLVRADQAIRAGQTFAVRTETEQWLGTKVSPGERAKLAAICRRIGAPELSLRLLHPVVYPSARRPVQASAAEKAEYGAALNQIGAPRECLSLLAGVKAPQALLFRSFAHFASWDYAAAEPLLREYIRAPQLADYDRLVGSVNLAAALVALEKNSEASTLLSQLSEAGKGLTMIEGNLALLSAQAALQDSRFGDAAADLAVLGKLGPAADGAGGLLTEKWAGILAWRSGRNRLEGRVKLHRVAKAAARQGRWEIFRDARFFLALAENDQAELARVFHGTPFPAYRSRIQRYAAVKEQSEYLLLLGRGGQKHPRAVLDSASAEWSTQAGKITPKLRAGSVPLRLLCALGSDLYRPLRIATLHESIFPGLKFHPGSSPAVLHQAIFRLRRALSEISCPLLIEERDRAYHLRSSASMALRLYPNTTGREDPRRAALLDHYLRSIPAGQSLTRAKAAVLWACSSRHAFTYLQEAVKQGRMMQTGRARSTVYKIKSPGL
ncbi:MAG: hypothetical protein ACXWR1_03590 [Bdellovibrionota bacterium]